MPAAAQVPLSMLVVFVSAKLLAEIFERLGQPGIVGQILAGILIGPQVLGWMAPNDVLRILSDLGVMFLLFSVGLEVRASELLRVGGTALVVAVAGVILPFFSGWGIARAAGMPHTVAVFIGASLVATSVGITAEVLSSRRFLHTRAAKVILGAAVADDVLGLIVLAVAGDLARGPIDYLDITLTAGIAILFTGFVAAFGTQTIGKVLPHVQNRLKLAEAEFAMAMTLLFGLALLAVYAGVAAIVGAFLAGMALGETVDRRVHDLTHGVTALLVPFFLVGIGLHFDLSIFSKGPVLALTSTVAIAAIASKFVACGLGASRMGRADAIRVGVGMVPRGEVGMVVAQIGLALGVMTPNAYSMIVFMSVATTLVAPPLLRMAFRGAPSESADPAIQ